LKKPITNTSAERILFASAARGKQKIVLATIFTFLLFIISACNGIQPPDIPDIIDNNANGKDVVGIDTEKADIAGLVTNDSGSITDYAGWWQLDEYDESIPFAFIEIPTDDPGRVFGYDGDGRLIADGWTDYNAQRALNGNALIVFIFDEIGDYGAYPYSAESDRYMHIVSGQSVDLYVYMDPQPD